MDSMVELKEIVIHQCQIPGQYSGTGKPPYKILEEGRMVYTYWEEKDRKIKGMSRLPTMLAQATRPNNIKGVWKKRKA